jgi:hypothetical protein
VILLEGHPSGLELGNLGLEVVDLPPSDGVLGGAGVRRPVEPEPGTTRGLIDQPGRLLTSWDETELVGVEGTGAFQIGGRDGGVDGVLPQQPVTCRFDQVSTAA